jgi:hypothetical protein
MLAISPSVAVAENWIEIGTSATGSVYSIDQETLKPEGTSVQVWVMANHAKDKSVKEETSKDHMLVDCENETITVQASYFYAADGTTTEGLTFEKHEQSQTLIIPGTVGEFIFDAACKK